LPPVQPLVPARAQANGALLEGIAAGPAVFGRQGFRSSLHRRRNRRSRSSVAACH